MRLARLVLVGLSLAGAVPHAAAQQLRDPTRPPVFIAPRASSLEPAQSSELVLQTVLISPERRHVVINGRLLSIGQSISGLKVVAINESEVLLSGGAGARKLRLYPAVDKRVPRVADSDRKAIRRPAPTQPQPEASGRES